MTSQADWLQATGSEELARGFKMQGEDVLCLLCGEVFEEGVIYPFGGQLFAASRAAKEHLSREHGRVVDFLLGLGKKHTGLSGTQSQVLQGWAQGQEDAEIASVLGIASSTVRNHRFRLKEKVRQARVFLAIMSLVDEVKQVDTFVAPHHSATMLDERYAVTHEQDEKIRRNAFTAQGRLKRFPAKEKKKLVVLRTISEQFEAERRYSEKEVNAVLQAIFDDFVTLRRYLIQYGFLQREKDGSAYWKI